MVQVLEAWNCSLECSREATSHISVIIGRFLSGGIFLLSAHTYNEHSIKLYSLKGTCSLLPTVTARRKFSQGHKFSMTPGCPTMANVISIT